MARDIRPVLIDSIVERLIKVIRKRAGIKRTEVILAGGLAMIAYGKPKRSTFDLDAEIITKDPALIERINYEFQDQGIPIDISDNISRWGMVDLPPGYRQRARLYKAAGPIKILLLSPIDLIISKLRVMRDQDIEDIEYLSKKFNFPFGRIKKAAKAAISISPQSTELLFFKKNLEYLKKCL